MNIYYKYPRTMHLYFSPGTQSDDRLLTKQETLDYFSGKEIVITEKIDGENASLYSDHYHARSLDSKHHESRNWIKQLHGSICAQIPQNYRICGENVFAKHSIFYNALNTYFYVFSIWNDKTCLSWDETKEWCELLGIAHAPVLYEGIWAEESVKVCFTGQSLLGGEQEGYVVRLKEQFEYDDFYKSCAKWVRPKHVQTSKHWLKEEIVPNLLK